MSRAPQNRTPAQEDSAALQAALGKALQEKADPLPEHLHKLADQAAHAVDARGRVLVEMIVRMSSSDSGRLKNAAASIQQRYGRDALVTFAYKTGLFRAPAGLIFQACRALLKPPFGTAAHKRWLEERREDTLEEIKQDAPGEPLWSPPPDEDTTVTEKRTAMEKVPPPRVLPLHKV